MGYACHFLEGFLTLSRGPDQALTLLGCWQSSARFLLFWSVAGFAGGFAGLGCLNAEQQALIHPVYRLKVRIAFYEGPFRLLCLRCSALDVSSSCQSNSLLQLMVFTLVQGRHHADRQHTRHWRHG